MRDWRHLQKKSPFHRAEMVQIQLDFFFFQLGFPFLPLLYFYITTKFRLLLSFLMKYELLPSGSCFSCHFLAMGCGLTQPWQLSSEHPECRFTFLLLVKCVAKRANISVVGDRMGARSSSQAVKLKAYIRRSIRPLGLQLCIRLKYLLSSCFQSSRFFL